MRAWRAAGASRSRARSRAWRLRCPSRLGTVVRRAPTRARGRTSAACASASVCRASRTRQSSGRTARSASRVGRASSRSSCATPAARGVRCTHGRCTRAARVRAPARATTDTGARRARPPARHARRGPSRTRPETGCAWSVRGITSAQRVVHGHSTAPRTALRRRGARWKTSASVCPGFGRGGSRCTGG